ncbi:hypothetical protein MKW92_040180 [Papaver armeniacum]|nr:hypothetical protein MKW92_040180 [Papaver armeniacum]
MDRELEPEELAYSIIASKKICSPITLAFILPLYFIYLAQTKISDNPEDGWFSFFLFGLTSEFGLMKFVHYAWLSIDLGIGIFSSFRVWLLLYHIFFLALSLLSTSTVVYTVACAYTKKEITFNKVKITVKPSKGLDGLGASILIGIIENIICTIGFVYINVIWHLDCVVSVMEKSYGYKAILKSKALIKGNIWMASFIFITVQIFLMIVIATFHNLVIDNGRIGVMGKVSLGIFLFLLLFVLIHIGLVVQTVVYFVCKSYHQENIDKSWLAEHLEAYNVGDYDPLMGDKDIQLEQSGV